MTTAVNDLLLTNLISGGNGLLKPEAAVKDAFDKIISKAKEALPQTEIENANEQIEQKPKFKRIINLFDMFAAWQSGITAADQSIRQLQETQQTFSETGAVAPLAQMVAEILEGFDISGNTDIASLTADFEKYIDNSGLSKNETITARMPQITDLLDRNTLNEAAKEVVKMLKSYLCPLENNDDTAIKTNETNTQDNTISAFSDAVKALKESADSKNAESGQKKETGAHDFLFRPDGQVTQTGTIKLFNTPAQIQKPQAVAEAIEQIIERIETVKTGEQTSFTIDLKPGYLGKLEINLTMNESGLTAQIRAGDKDVSSMISARINELVNSLQEKGLSITNVDVVYAQTDTHSFAKKQSDQPYKEQRGNGRIYRTEAAETSGTADITALLGAEQFLNSTVMYRA